MHPKLKKWLIRGTVFGVVFFGSLALTGYLMRDFWYRQVRIYLHGQFDVRVEETGEFLPAIDQIEVLALGAVDRTVDGEEGQVSHYSASGRKTLRGQDAQDLAQLWRKLRRGPPAMCHEPGYALRFFSDGKLLFETTVCWKCTNYSVEAGVPGFRSFSFQGFINDATGQNLLALLKTHLPPATDSPPTIASGQ